MEATWNFLGAKDLPQKADPDAPPRGSRSLDECPACKASQFWFRIKALRFRGI